MIVESQNGAGLEVFWRHRGGRGWTYDTALRFVSQFRLEREAIQSLRSLLSRHSATGASWRLPDDEVLERAARLIYSGLVVVAEYRSRDRWPGTGIVLRPRGQAVLLIPRETLSPARDLSKAYEWLDELQAAQEDTEKPGDGTKTLQPNFQQLDHKAEMARLRVMLASSDWAPNMTFFPDDVLLSEIRRALQSGLLIPIYHSLGGTGVESPESVLPPPPVQRGASERVEAVEGSTFGPDHSGSTQAATLAEAAESGVPFCEECQRAARQGSRL